jgi:hypothetical protein
MSKGRLEKSLDYLAWHWQVACVLDVFRENQMHYRPGTGDMKPSADGWCLFEELRHDLHRRACRFWCARTSYDKTYFPLSVDATARLYFRIRKRRHDEIEDFEREIAEAIGMREGGDQLPFGGSLFDDKDE